MTSSRRALVVSVDQYADPSLHDLASPATDAQELVKVLGDPQLGDFVVDVLYNCQARQIALRLEDLLTDNSPDDVILVHFSCHGIKDDSGLLYLAAADTLPTRLASTAVDANVVNRLIRRSRAGQVILFLDCCYGGAFERGMVPRAAGDVGLESQFRQPEPGRGRGRVVITASSAVEYAFEGEQLQDGAKPPPSIFTRALSEGLTTGAADADQDGKVLLDELYEYVYQQVRAANPKQTPSKWEYGTQGQLVIARNPHRRLPHVDLPADLLDLLSHPFPATRKGAVEELAKLAASEDLPKAAAAREHLLRMQDDDSRQVSIAAKAASEATALQLSQSLLDFGFIPVGKPASITVNLIGPPLVTASNVRTEGDVGIEATQAERAIVVGVNSTSARTVSGRVAVDGPAGNASLDVKAVVIPQSSAERDAPKRKNSGKPSPSSSKPPKQRNEAQALPSPVPADRESATGNGKTHTGPLSGTVGPAQQWENGQSAPQPAASPGTGAAATEGAILSAAASHSSQPAATVLVNRPGRAGARESAGAAASPSRSRGSRPTLVFGASVGAAALLLATVFWMLTPRSIAPPGVPSRITTASALDLMLTSVDIGTLGGIDWAQSTSTDDAARPICLAAAGDDLPNANTSSRKIVAADSKLGSVVQLVELYLDAAAATNAYTVLRARTGTCKDSIVWITSANSVSGLADASDAISYVVQGQKNQFHTLLLSRTGRAVSMVDVTTTDTAVPVTDVAQVMKLALNRQCAGLGACPGNIVSDVTPPSPADPKGWLVEADLPRITPGAGRWGGTDPTTSLEIVGSLCEGIDLRTVPGKVAAGQRTLLLDDIHAPTGFGVDMVTYDFRASNDATILANKLVKNLDDCPSRASTASVADGPSIEGSTDGGPRVAGSTFLITHKTKGRSVVFRIAVLTVGTKVVYLLANPSADFDFSDAEWKAIAVRAGQRANQWG